LQKGGNPAVPDLLGLMGMLQNRPEAATSDIAANFSATAGGLMSSGVASFD
jgi:hypothetical protein